jgi:hypothetical protein
MELGILQNPTGVSPEGSSRPLHKVGPGKAGQLEGLTSPERRQSGYRPFLHIENITECTIEKEWVPDQVTKEHDHTIFAFDMLHSSTWIPANLIRII